MDSVSRPLIALLLGTVAVFALWLVALKPGSSPGGASASSPGAFSSAIAKARQAVASSGPARDGHERTAVIATPSRTGPPAAESHAQAPSAAFTAHPVRGGHAPAQAARTSASAGRAWTVTRALRANRTIALLFYNPAGADDLAIRQELAAVPVNSGRVVKLSVPLGELAHYPAVTNQVTVNASPTLVVIDRSHRASTLVGFADRFEIAQRVADAVAAP